MTRRLLPLTVALAATALLPSISSAHKDDYLNETFVYRTLDRGELELEYWYDYHELKAPGTGHYQHTASSEYGITDKFMADVAFNFSNFRSPQIYELSRVRVETRRRFGEEGQHFPDLAASLEFEAEKDPVEWEYQLTPRLVLSHDFGRDFNTTVNLFTSVPIGRSADVVPGYNLGLRYPSEGFLRVGAEVIQTIDHGFVSEVIPQIWILPWSEDVLKIGYSKTFRQDQRYYIRAAIEIGL